MSRAAKRDKELALEMWRMVFGYVCREEQCNLHKLKEKFCYDNNIDWYCDCLLCEIHRDRCDECELGEYGGCDDDDSDFFIVFDYLDKPDACNKKSAIQACENIIKAIDSLEEENSE